MGSSIINRTRSIKCPADFADLSIPDDPSGHPDSAGLSAFIGAAYCRWRFSLSPFYS